MNDKLQFDLRFLFGVVLAISLGIGLYNWMKTINRNVQDSSSLAFTSLLVVQHLESNQSRWPNSWQELEDDYQIVADRSGALWSLSQLKQRVAIEWNVETTEYFQRIEKLEQRGLNYPQSLQSKEFEEISKLITLKNNRNVVWSSQDSGTILFDFFKREHGKQRRKNDR